MPETNLGFYQGDAIPFYVIIKSATGTLVPQPPHLPSIEIAYIEAGTNVRKTSVPKTRMTEIESGRHFFVWRVPQNEEVVNHVVIITGLIDGEIVVASSDTFATTSIVQTPIFKVNINILENPGICYPEVMAEVPKCSGRRSLPTSHANEQDIGLNDFAIDGSFRFGDYPNQVVDRRVIGGTTFTLGLVRNFALSTTPGAGPAQRPGNPLVQGPYTARRRYRY